MDSTSKPAQSARFSWKVLVYNLAFFLNGLLVFLLIFESRFTVPFWMQSVGRMHPLVLHFPLVVLMLYAFWVLIVEKAESTRWSADLAETLLLIGVLTAVIAAFSGFILSREEGYEQEALFWHKWLGVGISLASLVWYGLRNLLFPWKPFTKLVAVLFLLLLLTGGHLGGNLTHGEDFLISPIELSAGPTVKVAIDQAKVYDDLIQPVFQQKCYSCHSAEKSKGSLQMQTRELLIKGGKNGVLWDTTKADLGILMSRIHLPLDDKKHMPPRGKVQLTDEEIVLFASWIKEGARFDQMVSALSTKSPVYSYAQNVLGGDRAEEQYGFSGADQDKVKELNTTYRLVKSISAESPALFVNFYNRANFKSTDISELLPLKEQIISMDLSKMPVKDEDLKTLAEFRELRQLLLNFTDITGTSLSELKKLPRLKELSLSGTAVKRNQLAALEEMPALRKVYVWSTNISPDELAQLKKIRKIDFETGFRSDTLILALNAPVIETEEPIVPRLGTIKMKHQIPGAVIRYTLDGTEPDSLKSPVYAKPFPIDKNIELKARAFKPGWLGSKQVNKLFFKAGYPIDSVRLITPPDPKYIVKGGNILKDGIKSDNSPTSGKWLGYREVPFETYLFFKKPVSANTVTLSMLRNVGGYIFPPVRIEVWGGPNEKSLKLLKVLTPEMPDQKTENRGILIFPCEFPQQELGCVKVIAKPLAKLPPWHPGKGEKAWVFVDEILIN